MAQTRHCFGLKKELLQVRTCVMRIGRYAPVTYPNGYIVLVTFYAIFCKPILRQILRDLTCLLGLCKESGKQQGFCSQALELSLN